MGFQGEVGWTFGKKEDKPKPRRDFFLGINIGIGFGFGFDEVYESHYNEYYGYDDYYYDYESFVALHVTIGVDFAYPLTDKFNLGAYTSFGFVRNFNMSFGALTLFDTKNNAAFLAGIGGNFDAYEGHLGLDARIGYKFKNNFYLTGEFLLNNNYDNEDWKKYGGTPPEGLQHLRAFLIHFGYNIGGLF